MTPDQTPHSDPSPTPEEGMPQDPQTVEAEVVESTSEPSKTPSKTKATPDTAKANDSMAQVKAVGAELWKQAKPVLQKIGTQALILGNRGTDFLLDKAFPTARDKVIQVLPADFKAQAQAKIDPVKEKVVPIWQKVWPWLKKTVGPLWAKAIAFLRSKLPADLSGQLSDRFLNILLVTAIYLVWSFFSGLTHPSQAKPPESDLKFPEVKNKPSMTAPERAKPQPPATTAPKVSTPAVEPKPAPAPKIEPNPVVTPPKPSIVDEKKSPAPKPVEPVKKTESVTPAPIEPAKKIEPIKAPITSKPAPPQPVETKPVPPTQPIKPVQPMQPVKSGPDLVALKADLVDSVERVVDDAPAMIGKVGVNQKQVQVELGDRWYSLSEQDQSKLADHLFSKSKKLDYERLDMRDTKGEQVARSPYLGNDMIILKRSAPGRTSTSGPDNPVKPAQSE